MMDNDPTQTQQQPDHHETPPSPSRRRFLKFIGFTGVTVAAAACGVLPKQPAETPPPEKTEDTAFERAKHGAEVMYKGIETTVTRAYDVLKKDDKWHQETYEDGVRVLLNREEILDDDDGDRPANSAPFVRAQYDKATGELTIRITDDGGSKDQSKEHVRPSLSVTAQLEPGNPMDRDEWTPELLLEVLPLLLPSENGGHTVVTKLSGGTDADVGGVISEGPAPPDYPGATVTIEPTDRGEYRYQVGIGDRAVASHTPEDEAYSDYANTAQTIIEKAAQQLA